VIKSLVFCRLTNVEVVDNQTVTSGQHLFTVTTEDIETQLKYFSTKRKTAFD
jgi:multidrug resistance efflux pump